MPFIRQALKNSLSVYRKLRRQTHQFSSCKATCKESRSDSFLCAGVRSENSCCCRETIYKDEVDMLMEGKTCEEIMKIVEKREKEQKEKETKLREERAEKEKLETWFDVSRLIKPRSLLIPYL